MGSLLGLPGRLLRALDDRLLGGRPARAVREHRGLAAFVTVAIVFGAAYVNFDRYPELRDRERAAAGPAVDDTSAAGTDATTGADAVGPVVGARVEDYLAARRDALAEAPAGDRVAVVSFGEFLDPALVGDLLVGTEVLAAQYQLPERTPAPERVAVDGSVEAAMAEVIEQTVTGLRAEEEGVRSTLESGVDDPAFQADFEARLDELVALRNTLTQDPRVVFASVVRAPVASLRELATAPQVRLVDLAPEDVDVGATTFHGVLPTARERIDAGRT